MKSKITFLFVCGLCFAMSQEFEISINPNQMEVRESSVQNVTVSLICDDGRKQCSELMPEKIYFEVDSSQFEFWIYLNETEKKIGTTSPSWYNYEDRDNFVSINDFSPGE